MKNFIILILLSSIGFLNAQSYIDHEQNRIDGMDGKMDGFLAMRDLNLRNSATHTYIYIIDDLQDAILNNDNIDVNNKVILYKELNKELFKILLVI